MERAVTCALRGGPKRATLTGRVIQIPRVILCLLVALNTETWRDIE